MAVMVIFAQGAVVAGPAIIAWGIDVALPELLDGNSIPVLQATAMHMGAAIVGGVLTYGYVRQSVVVGQKMLLSLRRRVFRFTQRQDLEFHERSEEHTSELQSRGHLVCRLLLEKKKN